MRQWLRSNLTYANVMATIAAFLALSGTAAAALIITDNSQVAQNTISGHQPPVGKHANIIAGSVNGQDVAADSLTGAKINESTLAGFWRLAGNAGTTSSNFLGTTDNKPLNLRVNNARGLRIEPASDGTNQSPNVIGGIADNQVTGGVHSATIGGGGRGDPGNPATANRVSDNYGTVGGGANNLAGDAAGSVSDAPFGTVAGGARNTASGFAATAVGGAQNTAQGDYSLAAGRNASAGQDGSFVWADSHFWGFSSTAPNQFAVRATGGARFISGDALGTPTSGLELPAGTSGWSTLGNGQPFDVRVNDARGLRIDPASDGTNQSPNVIGGIADNRVDSSVFAATISGGGRGDPSQPATANRVSDNYGTVGGGANNLAGDGAGTVGDRTLATVGGGVDNLANGEAATVAGGSNTTAGPGTAASAGGGLDNWASGAFATVGGGAVNLASGIQATVGGGQDNEATGFDATVGGGAHDIASGVRATVPGGYFNTAQGDYSLAAGRRAKVIHQGAFVWADSSDFNFASTAQDQFSVRSTGGARFVSAIDGTTGDPTAGVTLAPGGGSWASLSDEASKTGITPVSGKAVLRKLGSVPISEWSYRAQGPSIRHIGPMAQDLSRAFGVGEDPRHITSVDADGISLAAIKALNQKVRALQGQVGVPAGDSAGPSGEGSSLPVWALVAFAMLGLAGAAALGAALALRWQRTPATG